MLSNQNSASQVSIEDQHKILNFVNDLEKQNRKQYDEQFEPEFASKYPTSLYNVSRCKLYRNMRASITTPKTGNSVIYLFCAMGGKTAKYAYIYGKREDFDNDRFKNAIISFGPSYVSQDGEFHSIVLPMASLVDLSQTLTENDCAISINKNIVQAEYQDKSIEFNLRYVSSANTKNYRMNEQIMSKHNLWWRRIFVINVLLVMGMKKRGLVESNIDTSYMSIFGRDWVGEQKQPADVCLGIEWMLSALMRLRFTAPFIQMPQRNMIFGKKLFPVTVAEALHPEDINYPLWKGLYLSYLVSSLIVNGISPCYPLFSNWFYVRDTNFRLFNSSTMFTKYRDHNIAEIISQQLGEIDKLNFTDPENPVIPRAHKFKNLSKYIKGAARYADGAIKLCDLIIVATMENCGITVNNSNDRWYTQPNYIYRNNSFFDKIMFDFVYGLLCLNSKLMIIHGDMDTNNATLYVKMYVGKLGGSEKKFAEIYSIGGDVYSMPSIFVTGCIIDFSRSIFADVTRLENEFSERFREIFLSNQRKSLLDYIYDTFPKLSHRDGIESLCEHNFGLLFKIATSCDTYRLFNMMIPLYENMEFVNAEGGRMTPHMIDLVKKISALSTELFNTNIENALFGKISKIDDIEWPNLVIIKTCFGEYKINSPQDVDPGIINIDRFSFDNDLEYGLESREAWPPFMNYSNDIETLAKHDIKVMTGAKRDLFEILSEVNKNMETIETTNDTTGMIEIINTLPVSKDELPSYDAVFFNQ